MKKQSKSGKISSTWMRKLPRWRLYLCEALNLSYKWLELQIVTEKGGWITEKLWARQDTRSGNEAKGWGADSSAASETRLWELTVIACRSNARGPNSVHSLDNEGDQETTTSAKYPSEISQSPWWSEQRQDITFSHLDQGYLNCIQSSLVLVFLYMNVCLYGAIG